MLNGRECYFCGRTDGLERHHIFGGRNRPLCDRDGLTVWLCHEHHTGRNGVHSNREMMDALHVIGQEEYLKRHSMDEWMRRYGRDYLED